MTTISDRTGQDKTITEGWQALRLFSNRRSLIRHFVNYINDDSPNKILYFYGDGGNGKSLLMRYLQEHYCKRFTDDYWNKVLKLETDHDKFIEIAKIAEENIEPIPFTIIDFGLSSTNENQPKIPFYGLLMLRRQLAKHNIKFPLFDFACVWYMHKTNQLNADRIKNLLPTEEIDFAVEIVNTFSDTTWGAIFKGGLNIFAKHTKDKVDIYLKKRGIEKEKIEEIERMEPEAELIKTLPKFFAEDLNFALEQKNAPSKVVLFFDTHESFWGRQRNVSEYAYFSQDEWLRVLISNLEFNKGIIPIVAGRERPRWADAPKSKIPNEYLDIHLIGHLKPKDADYFLRKVGIDDEKLRKNIINFAKVEENEIHPYYLGLCGDIILAAERNKTPITAEDFAESPDVADKQRILINRFLSYVEKDVKNAVIMLSACRAFDYEIYQYLITKSDDIRSETSFEILNSFSFVWQSDKEVNNLYQIHDLLTDLFAEHEKEKHKKAHTELEAFYRKKHADGDELAIAEAIYHLNKLEPEKSVSEWIEVFDNSHRHSKHDLCRSLIEVRREMQIDADFDIGRALYLEGKFYFGLSLYDDAHKNYQDSITIYCQLPEDEFVLNNKGNVLQSLGALQAGLSKTDEAIKSYEESIKAYDEALKLAPNDVYALNNKGNVLQRLGDLQAGLSKTDEAIKSYEESIKAYDEALKLAPNDVYALNNKGLLFLRWAELEFDLEQIERGLQKLNLSLEQLTKSLKLAPNNLRIQNHIQEVKDLIETHSPGD